MPCTAIAATGFSVARQAGHEAPRAGVAGTPPSTDASTSVRALRWSANAAASSTTTAVPSALSAASAPGGTLSRWAKTTIASFDSPRRMVTMLRIVTRWPLRAVARKVSTCRLRADVGERLRDDLGGQSARSPTGRPVGHVGDVHRPASARDRR